MSSDQTGITQLTSGLSAVGSVSLLGQRDMRAVVEQQVINNLPQFPNLAAVQEATVPFGNQWLDDVQPALIGIAEDIINYADGVQTYYDRIEELLGEGGNASVLSEIAEGLQELNRQALGCQQNAQGALSLLQKFNLGYAYAVGGFDTEAKDVIDNLTSSSGAIAQLQTQISGYETKLQSDNETISEGATKDLPGIFEVTVGAIMALETEGEETELLKAGIEYIGEAENEIKEASDDAKATLQLYSAALTQLSADEAALVVITSVQISVDNLRNDGTAASDAAQAVSDAWGTVMSYQSSVASINDLQQMRSTMGGAFKQYVADWNNLHQMAESLTDIGTMNVQQATSSGG
ncbi:MAG TPA: HBL/NHE enterotoxin family protein [Pyrinomonadaceae bacterium]|jgi:hypothetical protein